MAIAERAEEHCPAPRLGLETRTRVACPGDEPRTSKMINFLGTIIFATIIGIGWLDSRGDLSLFGKYSSLGGHLRPRPRAAERRDGEDQPKPPAGAL